MIFDLAQDFHGALAAMPPDHPRHHMLGLLEEALRRDIHFIDRHPTTLFQCMWNRCWWYDCPEAAKYYVLPREMPLFPRLLRSLCRLLRRRKRQACSPHPPSTSPGTRLSLLMERAREMHKGRHPASPWLRSLRPPPLHLGTAQRAVFQGHTASVSGVAFSPDGARIASGSSDDTIRVWDVATSAQIQAFRGHDGIRSVAFSPDGKHVASGSWDKTVSIWDATTGALGEVLEGLRDWRENFVVFSPDSTCIVTAWGENAARVWDAGTGACLRTLEGHTGSVTSAAFSPDGGRSGGRIVSGSCDCTIRLWDAMTGACIRILEGHTGRICRQYGPTGSFCMFVG